MATTTFERSINSGLQVGNNYGRIDAHVHPPERPESPPRPSCALPFRRDPDFVDRGTILDQIHEKSLAPASRIALVGLGGVGKSQLAIEHCYRVKDRSPETWVFWVHASNAVRLEQGFRDIADRVKLKGRNDHADVFKLVHDWLRDEQKAQWLLVLDNADDAAVLSPVSRSLPPNRHGAVIVTSRTKGATSCLVEDDDVIAVKPMQEADALALLTRKLGNENEHDVTIELAAALEYMPLALVQAAAFIKKRAPRWSVRRYLDEFRRNDNAKTSLLNYEAGNLRRDSEAKNSIIITWQISFDYVRRVRSSAANLLSLMSFFDRQGIQDYLLHSYEERDVEQSSEESNEESEEFSQECEESKFAFEDDIDMLREFSFISPTTAADAFEMHSLVQLATRRWLKSQGQLEQWKQQYISNLCAKFPSGKYENWAKCQALFPHAMAAVEQRPRNNYFLHKWALLLYNAGWFANERGQVGEAETMCILSMEVNKELLGEEHIDTLNSMVLVGSVNLTRYRWKEAEELYVRVIKTQKRVLGEEHPATLLSIGNLASSLSEQGQWKEAEELFVQIIKTRKRVLGEEHPETLTSINNLASVLVTQGRCNEARELMIQVLETEKKVVGEEHPSTLASIHNLASILIEQGQWKEAKELLIQVLETQKRVLGEDHLRTLASIHNLASTFQTQGHWKKAEELYVQVLERSKRVFGEDHLRTLVTMHSLAFTLYKQGYYSEAIPLMERCYVLRQQVLGIEHPSTLETMHNLAANLYVVGHYNRATSLMEECCVLSQQVLGQDHLNTVSSLEVLQDWKDKEQARIEEQARIDEQARGDLETWTRGRLRKKRRVKSVAA